MKTLKSILGLSGVAASFALVASFSAPVETGAFGLLGHSLGTTQRDFRVFNNFTDTQANNNTTPHANFPGALGALQAIWKGHVEWTSVNWAGNGLGDSTQAILGASNANYDAKYEGTATSTGGTSSNIHSELSGSSGGVLAFMQGGGSGWWVRYYATWTWQDGPGSVGSGTDLQGVACHEIGHAIGLDHTGTGGATMFPSISGTGQGQRSIETDDRNGVLAIYGTVAAGKPRITGLSGSTTVGQVLTITGQNFATTAVNDVWFTKNASNGVSTKVTNIAATSGGTVLNVTIPSGIQDGDVMVQNKNLTSHGSLSNAWPIDIGGGGNVPLLSSVSPNVGPAGGWTEVTITGGNFTGATNVRFGGVESNGFTVDSSTEITAFTPAGTLFQSVDVEVQNSSGTGLLSSAYIYGFNPTPSVSTIEPTSGPTTGGTLVSISGSSVVGVTSVTFDGVAGTNLVITSGTTLDVETPAGSSGPADVEVIGSGSDILAGGFNYNAGPGGAFVNIGPGITGSFGVPLYTGTGDLTTGSLTGYSTTVGGAIPFNAGFLFLSLTEGAVPFKTGTLYPFPIVAQVVVPMDGTGALTIPHIIPAGQGYEGLDIIAQWWFADGAAPAGASASNGLRLEIP